MRVELVCVALAALAVSFPSLSDGAPLQVLSAPNLLRVGSKEKVLVEIQDNTGGEVKVTILVKNHPSRSRELVSKQVVLNTNNNFQELTEILIPGDSFKDQDARQKQYVYLQAHFPGLQQPLEKVVLLSFQSGYIFIQTDKPLYTPGTKVNFRALAVTPDLEPLTKDQFVKDTSISIEIMTPENITIHRETAHPEMGMKSGNYKLPDIASFGVWKVVSRFTSTPQKTFSAEFEVKEYVLPSFEVKLKPRKAFFYVDDKDLTVDIEARYLFGKEVNGAAHVVFGVNTGNEKRSFPNSLQRVEISQGKGEAMLELAHITQTYPKITDLAKAGASLYVSAYVQTESGGEMVEAEKRGIKIVTSPYTIHFKKTSKFFKPGMPFNVKVYVTNPDGSRADRVPLEVTPGPVTPVTDDNGEVAVTVNSKRDASELPITVKTKDIHILPNRQASASMKALPYKTNTNNLLHISVDSSVVELGSNMKMDLNIAGALAAANMDITYMILSKGQLVKAHRFKKQGQQGLVSLNEQITKEMLPSFRIVAYYHVGASEVVSDSVWVDIKVSCMGTLKVQMKRETNTYKPRNNYGLRITGDPGAKVGLVAVDKGISVLNNLHRLTQKKVWDIVEKHDTGCTVGSGKNSMGVFYDAGLVFVTPTTGTDSRTEPDCPVVSRRRRAVTLMDVRTSLVSKFSDETQRSCCMDGMKDNSLGYTCERRSQYITDGPVCKEAFLHCCKELETKKKEEKHEKLIHGLSEEDDEFYMGADEITSRSNFPESWFWNDYILEKCKPGKRCEPQSKDVNMIMPDSITTWQLFAISLSKDYGVCVIDPYEMIVLKNFFIDLRLPYSAVYNEQLEIKAVLHNYLQDDIKVRLELLENADVCSSASNQGKFRQIVEIPAESTLVVPFVIIPMKQGDQVIELKASVYDSGVNDGIKKTLRVVPPGELVKDPVYIDLDPKGNTVEIPVTSGSIRNQIPDTPSSKEISLTAGAQISVLVETAISGTSMGSLIVQPVGCGEQNMIYMTLPVIATTYLDQTNQWESVGFEKRGTAITYIKSGYERELAYRKSDGSYAAWTSRPSSTWLTAYVAKVFAMASQLITIQDTVLCSAIKWLILNAQQPDGSFIEKNQVIHGEMTGDVRGVDSDVSMTAFVLIAMQEARALCEASENSMPGSMDKAVTYLEKRLPTATNPYAVAIASYALANVGKLDKKLLMKFAPGMDHWPVPRGHTYTLEATAYALLALVKVEALEEAGAIVRWFNKQKKVGGGYGSTQATIMVYQAVSEYWANAKDIKEFRMQVDLNFAGRSKPVEFTFNTNNQFITRTAKAQVSENLTVKASGTGRATLTMVTLYYAQLEESASDCASFDLKVDLVLQDKVTYPDAIESYLLEIEILYKNKDRDATMSVLDIGLLTGFVVDVGDLNQLKNGKDRYIEKFEIDTELSKRGSLIIYLDKVSHKLPDRVNFKIHKVANVGVLQPGTVTVYEYYEPRRCRKFYHPERLDGGLLRLCEEDNKSICKCAEENCPEKQELVHVSDATAIEKQDETRIAKACEVTLKSKIDYVYKATVQGIVKTTTTDKYTLRIDQVIKEGTDRNVEGQLRIFIGFSYCRDSLGLKNGRSYLLMGLGKDMYTSAGTNNQYHYILGEHMWVEDWPSPAECQTARYRNTCKGLEGLIQDQRNNGCVQ